MFGNEVLATGTAESSGDRSVAVPADPGRRVSGCSPSFRRSQDCESSFSSNVCQMTLSAPCTSRHRSASLARSPTAWIRVAALPSCPRVRSRFLTSLADKTPKWQLPCQARRVWPPTRTRGAQRLAFSRAVNRRLRILVRLHNLFANLIVSYAPPQETQQRRLPFR